MHVYTGYTRSTMVRIQDMTCRCIVCTHTDAERETISADTAFPTQMRVRRSWRATLLVMKADNIPAKCVRVIDKGTQLGAHLGGADTKSLTTCLLISWYMGYACEGGMPVSTMCANAVTERHRMFRLCVVIQEKERLMCCVGHGTFGRGP